MKRVIPSVITYRYFMRNVVLVLALILTSMSAAAGLNNTEQPIAWGTTTEGCRLSVSADQPSYRFDQPIGLRLASENKGDKPVLILQTYLIFIYRFDVRLPDGKPAPLTLEGHRQQEIGARSLNPLEPGQSQVDSVPMLNRLYDMTLLGEYTVTVYRNVWSHGRKEKPVEVPSNTLKILVHDKETQKR